MHDVGDLSLFNARFKSRVRRSKTVCLVIARSYVLHVNDRRALQTVVEINGGEVKARAVGIEGKRTALTVFKGTLRGEIENVRVVGREEGTNAECSRDEFLLLLLQGIASLDHAKFATKIWFTNTKKYVPRNVARKKAEANVEATRAVKYFDRLNESQRLVAGAMISEEEPIVVAQGVSYSIERGTKQ